MTSKIYLARHGQTYFNLEDRHGGDSELTIKGEQHAESVADWLRQFRLDVIYCSPLKRTVKTAEIIQKYHSGVPLVRVPELREIISGSIDSLSNQEFKDKYPEEFAARNKDKFRWVFPNGESYETATQRVRPFIDGLRQKDGCFAFVGHQGINRVIMGYLVGIPEEDIPYIETPNDVLFEVDLESKRVFNIRDGCRETGYRVVR